MGWVRHVAWASGEVHTGFWWANLRGKGHFEGLGLDGRIILKGIFKKWGGAWPGLIWLRIGDKRRIIANLRLP
jgi:hypothetical protein